MSMIIRPETVSDYPAVAAVVARAFDPEFCVTTIIALKRQRLEYDPELSLVAEVNGQVVGHVLFTPMTLRLLDQDVKAVNLSPLGIDPAYQRQGIGGALIEEGHRIARQKGYTVTNLLGHDTYYPRFGYLTRAFGACSIEIPAEKLPQLDADDQTLTYRIPAEADLTALQALWQHEEHDVDFAIDPGSMLLDWISPNPAIEARVYRRDDQIVGYVRGKTAARSTPDVFLASDADAACWIAGSLASASGSATVKLPVHPYSASGQEFASLGKIECIAWGAGMAQSLVAGTPFDDYYARVQRGDRLPGRPIWGTAFDLA